MNRTITSASARLIARCAALCATALLTACSMPSMNIWPFSDTNTGSIPVPANATQYLCNGGNSFWLRKLADGNLWVIYPDRQIRLDKQGDGQRYSNGIAMLEFEGAVASLRDGPQISYSSCSVAAPKK
jgi:hypothetical protein